MRPEGVLDRCFHGRTLAKIERESWLAGPDPAKDLASPFAKEAFTLLAEAEAKPLQGFAARYGRYFSMKASIESARKSGTAAPKRACAQSHQAISISASSCASVKRRRIGRAGTPATMV